ncbi:sulfite exporter TauE/SafE family protein [Marinobacterium stanieri]|uniref:sulfite exporter TauE/SafE family protein n=1 Tax=Marinobacterium stanieri TaxID=49186 RepID=UPI003A900DB2
MTEFPAILAAVLFGLAGSTHCIGMCGGIAGSVALSASGKASTPLYLLGFNVGRLLSYAIAGLLVGQFGAILAQGQALTIGLRTVAALIMIVMGLYIAQWWQGAAYLERVGQIIWRRIQPLTKAFLPADRLWKCLFLGGLWGWLPCGLVYTTLIWAGTTGQSAPESAMLMLLFGLGTLPAMMTTSVLAGQLRQALQRKGVRQSAGALVIIFGLLTLPWQGLLGHA